MADSFMQGYFHGTWLLQNLLDVTRKPLPNYPPGFLISAFEVVMRSGLFNGPIEARIQELINNAFQHAGIDTNQTLHETILSVMRVTTADHIGRIKSLEMRVRRQEVVLARVITTLDKLSERVHRLERASSKHSRSATASSSTPSETFLAN